MQQNISLQKFEFREGMVCLQMSSVFVSFFPLNNFAFDLFSSVLIPLYVFDVYVTEGK